MIKMTDPVTTIAVGSILNLAFQEFVKSGAGEVAKKAVGGTIDLAKQLRDKIVAKFQGNVKAEAAIAAVETGGDSAALKKLEVYLEDVMSDDAVFATELRQVAQQIINIQNQTTSNREYKNYGGDQNNFETVNGNVIIGGS
jgi:hypothetical protein